MKSGKARVLLIGFRNPGRVDDGLGPALATCIEYLALPGVSVESDYQLTVEHAHDISNFDVAIFADADTSGREPFYFNRLAPSATSGLGSHEVSPGEVVSLALTLFGAKTRSYMLGIRGYEFNSFGERLSKLASENLKAAVDFISNVARNGNFDEAAETFSDTGKTTVEISLDEISLN